MDRPSVDMSQEQYSSMGDKYDQSTRRLLGDLGLPSDSNTVDHETSYGSNLDLSGSSGIQLPPFSSLVHSVDENGSHSRAQLSSAAPNTSVNNSVSQRQSRDLSRGHNFNISYKAPSEDFRSPLNDYTFYRKFESASKPPALQIGSAESRVPLDRNTSRGPFTMNIQPLSTGRNNHTSTAPARVMGTPYRRLVIPSSASKPSLELSQPPAPELINPQPSSSIPDRESKLKTVTCRLNGCNAQCLGKEAFMKHLKADHRDTISRLALQGGTNQYVAAGTVAADKVQCPWPGCVHMSTARFISQHLPTHAKIRFRCPLCPSTSRSFATRLTDYRKHFEAAHHDEFQAGHFWYNEERHS